MAATARVIENPISGERIVIRQSGEETGGRLLSFDLYRDIWLGYRGWDGVKRRLELEPQLYRLRNMLLVEQSILDLGSLNGTGPCPNC